jgi:hypothetical protein
MLLNYLTSCRSAKSSKMLDGLLNIFGHQSTSTNLLRIPIPTSMYTLGNFLYRLLMWRKYSYFLFRKSANWWRRRKATDYLPAYSADNKPLIDYLTKLKLLGHSDRLENSNLTLKYMLDIIWSFFESFLEPHFLIWALAGQAATVIVCFL